MGNDNTTVIGEESVTRVPSRRSMIGAAAFAVPAIAMVATSPAFAGTGQRKVTMTATPVPGSAASSTDGGRGDQVSGAALGFEWNIVVTVTDAGTGAALAGQPVALSGPGGVSFGQANGTTNGSGQYSTIASISLTSIGSFTINAASAGTGGTVSTSTSLITRTRTVVVSLSPAAVSAGGASTVTARVTSGAGAPLAGETVTFSGSNVSFTQATGSTNSAGEYVTTVTSTGANGTSTSISATSTGAGGTAYGSAVLTVLGRVIAISFGSSKVLLGSSSTVPVTVTVTDTLGTPRSGEFVSLSPASGVTLSQTTGTTNSAGQFVTQATVIATETGATTITASSPGVGGTITTSGSLSYQAELTLTLSPNNVAAFNNSSIGTGPADFVATATLIDANGNPVKGAQIKFSQSQTNAVRWSIYNWGPEDLKNGVTNASGVQIKHGRSFAPWKGVTPFVYDTSPLTIIAMAPSGATATAILGRTG